MGKFTKWLGGLVDDVVDESVKASVKRGYHAVGKGALKATEPIRTSVQANPLVKAFFKKDDPSLLNAGLGIKMRTGASIGIGVGMTAVGGVIGAASGGAFHPTEFKAPQNVQYMGNIPGLDYDAVGNGDNTGNRGLGATGSLVFGLNAGRKG